MCKQDKNVNKENENEKSWLPVIIKRIFAKRDVENRNERKKVNNDIINKNLF